MESKRHLLTGFPSLAAFIASDQDKTTFIYKRFDELAARNLLYLQSELAELQHRQYAFDQADMSADMETKQCARNYADFEKAAASSSDTRQKERMSLVLQIRRTMKEYREALALETQLASLPPPSKKVLQAFRTEYYHEIPDKTKSFPTLGGRSAGLYDDADDLVALRVPENQDRLTAFVQDNLGFLFPVSINAKFKKDKENNGYRKIQAKEAVGSVEIARRHHLCIRSSY